MPKNTKINVNKEHCENIKNKILNLLNINETNNFFTIYQLDNDEILQNKILEFENDCLKYFPTSQWSYFRNKREHKKSERPYLLLLKNILNAIKFKINREQISIKINKTNIITSKYVLN